MAKQEARPKVRFSEIITPSGVVEVWSDLPFTEEEKTANAAANIKTRCIDYLYIPALVIGGTGKDAQECVKLTFSAYKDHESSLVNPKMPADIYLSGKDPKLSAWMGDTNESIRETFAAISAGVKDYEENLKEDGPATLRNIKEMVVDQLAKILCVLAGTEEIPEDFDVEPYLDAAYLVARKIERTNGRDDMKQIRLKAKKS